MGIQERKAQYLKLNQEKIPSKVFDNTSFDN